MPIDISGLSGSILKPSGDKQVQEQGQESAKQTSNSPAPSTDSVQLTGTAAQLRALESSLRDLPVIDAAKVESVKADLHNGQYAINPSRVADKMIRFEEMLNTRL